jgi:hypothetical protein
MILAPKSVTQAHLFVRAERGLPDELVDTISASLLLVNNEAYTEGDEEKPRYAGTGFFVSPRLAVTAAHVLLKEHQPKRALGEPPCLIDVWVREGTPEHRVCKEMELVHRDDDLDIAMLRLLPEDKGAHIDAWALA